MDFIAHWLWQGCVVTVVTLVILRFLDRVPSRVRYLVCWVAFSAVLLLPLMSAVSPAVSPLPVVVVTSAVSPPLPSVPDTSTWAPVLLAMWGFWLFAHAGQVAVATLAIRRVRARCTPFPPTLERRLRHWAQVRNRGRSTHLIVSDTVRAAAVIGCRSPLIAVAPALIQHLTADELDRIVIHEWAHIQRRDDVANVAQLTGRMLAGWHPALWWLDRRLQAEREMACDEMVVALTGSSKAYAACLVKLAGLALVRRGPLPALGVLSPAHLATRVQRIVSYKCSAAPAWSRTVAGTATVLLVGVSVAIGLFRFEEAVVVSSPLAATRAVTHSTPIQAAIDVPAPIAVAPVSGAARPQSAGATRPQSVDRNRRRGEASRPRQAASTSNRASSSTTPAIASTTVSDTPLENTTPSPSPDLPDVEASADASPPEALLPATSLPPPPEQRVGPWAATADAGVSLGQYSKKGGLGTAAFFTRLGKRLAGSF